MQHERLSTGILGLDKVLEGGLIPQRAYLVRGGPGAGKTTLGIEFLTAGTAQNESTLFISLGEAEEQVRSNASRLGFDTQAITFLDLSPGSTFFTEVETYDIFSPGGGRARTHYTAHCRAGTAASTPAGLYRCDDSVSLPLK